LSEDLIASRASAVIEFLVSPVPIRFSVIVLSPGMRLIRICSLGIYVFEVLLLPLALLLGLVLCSLICILGNILVS
jgi:hypothetical protein